MNWTPFILAFPGEKAAIPRSLDTPEGIGDRLRSAAFAEMQAHKAFLWAASCFETAPRELKKSWIFLAQEEQKHFNWLTNRMQELRIDLSSRTVSDQLWKSLIACLDAKSFTLYMASAEERGRKAGLRFQEALKKKDPISAEIFGQIAQEEIAHIRLATQFYPLESPLQHQN